MEAEQMVTVTDPQQPPATLLSKIGLLCPGLVMLYTSLARGGTQAQDQHQDPAKQRVMECPVTGRHTVALHMQKSLFTTTSDRWDREELTEDCYIMYCTCTSY